MPCPNQTPRFPKGLAATCAHTFRPGKYLPNLSLRPQTAASPNSQKKPDDFTYQPGRKLRRRNARVAKAASVAPRPVDKLRPVVRCPTIKYNRRIKPGKGFTFAELKV